jgi:hypothetical protein
MTEIDSLKRAARKQHKKLLALVGTPVPNSTETLLLYCSYPKDRMTWMEDHWDIPQYTNGSTRHAKCLFQIASTAVGGCNVSLYS